MLESKRLRRRIGRRMSEHLPVFLLILLLPGLSCQRPVRIPPATDVTESTPNPFQSNEKTLAEGKKLFLNNCAICHGHEGLGDGPSRSTLIAEPANLTTDPVASFADGKLFLAIRLGKMVNGRLTMPPVVKMTDEQIWKTVTYVKTLSSK